MKTPEDEAFEDIERRQGGFQAKRAMAADKLENESDMLTIAYLDGYEKGKRASLAQSAQEPPSEWASIKAILDEYGLQAIDFVADFKAALAQPAQEPVNKAAPAPRQPLTDEECDDLWDVQLIHITDKVSARQFIRDIEAAHGIKEIKNETSY